MKSCLLGEPFLMPLGKGLMVAFSQVQVLEVVREKSGARGAGREAGRAGQAAPHSARLYAAVV